jgi:hypothetical protein
MIKVREVFYGWMMVGISALVFAREHNDTLH